MTPDPRDRARAKKASRRKPVVAVPTRASREDPHEVKYFKRRREDDPAERVLGRVFLDRIPSKIRVRIRTVVVTVAESPPNRFAGGGMWEAMSGMNGVHEVRVDGPDRHHYRLFCILDYEAKGHDKPLLVILDGDDKPFRTKLPQSRYDEVKALAKEYFKTPTRSLA